MLKTHAQGADGSKGRCGARDRLVEPEDATCARCQTIIVEAVVASLLSPQERRRKAQWQARIRRRAYTEGNRELRRRYREEFRQLCADRRAELARLNPFR